MKDRDLGYEADHSAAASLSTNIAELGMAGVSSRHDQSCVMAYEGSTLPGIVCALCLPLSRPYRALVAVHARNSVFTAYRIDKLKWC